MEVYGGLWRFMEISVELVNYRLNKRLIIMKEEKL